jgi:hypothetical protein
MSRYQTLYLGANLNVRVISFLPRHDCEKLAHCSVSVDLRTEFHVRSGDARKPANTLQDYSLNKERFQSGFQEYVPTSELYRSVATGQC